MTYLTINVIVDEVAVAPVCAWRVHHDVCSVVECVVVGMSSIDGTNCRRDAVVASLSDDLIAGRVGPNDLDV